MPWALLAVFSVAMGSALISRPGAHSTPPATASAEGPSLPLPAPRNFPDQDTLFLAGGRWITDYAVDSLLQSAALFQLDRYRPDGAVIAVCDLRTGVIRALAERDSAGLRSRPRLALEATFPAASLAKILTAAAALGEKSAAPSDSLPMLGAQHTLYRFQLRRPGNLRHPKISLEQAFARSVNPVFGSLGLRMGAEPMRKMGEALGFNQPQFLECGQSRLEIPDTGFALAEVASGFTISTTISPLHALRIARGIGDDGRLRPLAFTSDLRNLEDGRRFVPPFPPPDPFLSDSALRDLRTLMVATVASGTASRSFRRVFRGQDTFQALELGGKTGSLNGMEPPGRYEWYAGYAKRGGRPDQDIALVVMTLNQNHRVAASELAARVVREWASPGFTVAARERPQSPRRARKKAA